MSEFFRPKIRLAGLVVAAGALVSAATVAGFLGALWWPLDLMSHFRVQYLAGLTVTAMLVALLKQHRAALVFLLFAVLNLGVIVPLYWNPGPTPASGSGRLRAMLINVSTAYGDPEAVRQAVRKFNPDILILEEVSASWMQELAMLEHDYPHRVARPREDNFGIALLSRLPLENARVIYIGAVGLPSVAATVRLPDGAFDILGTHPLPPDGRAYAKARDEQLARLPDFISSLSGPVLLLGDLNVSPWSHPYRRLLKATGLRDASRGCGVQPTWPVQVPALRIPIDHCLYSEGITIPDKRIGPAVGSDHFPVIVDFMVAGSEVPRARL
ncbi:MAG: endonuclease/exonuclease/phosphatase family protein [Kiritimatiellae bacterium]|nr:endonuclease/exonuclease/phosphatase family protein [Kiritimatiellia bacterium]